MLINRIDRKNLIEPIKSYGEYPIIITQIPFNEVDVLCVELGNEKYNQFSQGDIASIQAHFQIAVNEYKLKQAVLCIHGVFNAVKSGLDKKANKTSLKKDIINNEKENHIENSSLIANYFLNLDIKLIKENIFLIQLGSLNEPIKEKDIDDITVGAVNILDKNDFPSEMLKGLCFHHFLSVEAYKV